MREWCFGGGGGGISNGFNDTMGIVTNSTVGNGADNSGGGGGGNGGRGGSGIVIIAF